MRGSRRRVGLTPRGLFATALTAMGVRALPWTYSVLGALAVASVGLGLLAGAGDLGHAELGETFARLRAVRIAAAFVAGSALAVGGVVVQGLFRNPLASPSILGTTAGASFGGKLTLLLSQLSGASALHPFLRPEMFLPVGCILGALAALVVLLLVHRVGEDLVVLLLTGFLLSALFVALGGFVTSLAQERWELARAMIAFALGDVSGAGLHHVALGLPLVVCGGLAAFLWARPLDLMLSGEHEAASLGVDVVAVRRWCVIWTAVLTAAAVSIGGSIGFVGLVVPHVLRPYVGVVHRRLVPAAALLGGTFLVLCDALTRAVPSRTELPLGVVTGLIGAPVFLSLLLRSRREGAYG